MIQIWKELWDLQGKVQEARLPISDCPNDPKIKGLSEGVKDGRGKRESGKKGKESVIRKNGIERKFRTGRG